MSFSNSSTVPKRKRTISERVTENGDPFAVRKKAREATKKDSVTSSRAKASTTKKVTQV
jgi:hypothetical protein